MIDDLLRDGDLRAVAASLRPDAGELGGVDLGRAELDAAIARAAWSVLAEPGDGVAGALIAEFGAVEALRSALDERWHGLVSLDSETARAARALTDARNRWRPRASLRAVRDALDGARDVGATLLVPGDDCWPTSLDDLGANAPSALWVRGDVGLLAPAPHLAIVGARASSSYGDLIAAELSGDLADSGTVIVSGGAYGIDGAVHRAALGVGGPTIAFLAGGVDRAYPAGHAGLFRSIAEHGAVASELPCGAAPTKWRFLARNRLIAALGDATVVVEAGWRSGSLNTAGHASSLGRPLGTVPGPVTSATSAGCHRLLREYDAVCVTSSADVRELCGLDAGAGTAGGAEDSRRVRLLDAMSTRSAATSEELARRSGLAPGTVTSMLGLLELEGAVKRAVDGWCRAGDRRPRQ